MRFLINFESSKYVEQQQQHSTQTFYNKVFVLHVYLTSYRITLHLNEQTTKKVNKLNLCLSLEISEKTTTENIRKGDIKIERWR